MLEHSRQPKTEDELKMRVAIIPRLIALFARRQLGKEREILSGFADVYRVSVEKCFVPLKINEEIPLYFLDVGGSIMICCGEWLFDPHTLRARETVFEAWDGGLQFFANFTVRCDPVRGSVYAFYVEGGDFVPAQRLPCELKFNHLLECMVIPSAGGSLIEDLRLAGIAEPI